MIVIISPQLYLSHTLKTWLQTLRSKYTDGIFERYDPLKASSEKSWRQNLLHLQQKSREKMCLYKEYNKQHSHAAYNLNI